MGQYYMPIVQATKITKKRKLVKKMFAFNIADLNESKKITGHCEFESLISKIVSNFMPPKTAWVWAAIVRPVSRCVCPRAF